MEEFYESNVMCADDHIIHQFSNASTARTDYSSCRWITAPVDIPAPRRLWTSESVEDDYVASYRKLMLEPPHMLLSRRRMERKVAFSLCSGQGRTLKGRDLSRFRDSVLRMTGFLEE